MILQTRLCNQCLTVLEDGSRYEVEVFPEEAESGSLIVSSVDLCEHCKQKWFIELSRNRPKGVLILMAE